MKLIAHRGASLERPENTLESLEYGSELGAYAVECDVRMTSDNRYVIFHDDDLKRIGKDERRVDEVTLNEMKALIEANGRHLMTLEELFTYREKAFVLLHIKLRAPGDEFFRMLADSPVGFICGTSSVRMTATAAKFFAPERILAFMEIGNSPDRDTILDSAKKYSEAGAGIIRLWEQWLTIVTPGDVKALCPGAEVFIMSNRQESGMNGTDESLDELEKLGADGVLLNDIRLGTKHFKSPVR